MKELDDFTVERLEELAKNGGYTDHKEFTIQDVQKPEIISLAKIAIAVKGARIDERAAFNAWNNEDNLPIAGVPAKNAAWLAWQARASMPQPVSCGCQWTYDEHDYKWDSACGESWQFTDGGPEDNGVKFCQGCGKPVMPPAAPKGK